MRTPLVRYKDFSRGEGPRELTRGRTPGPPERTTCVDPAKDFSFPWLRHIVITLVPRSLDRSEKELPRCRLNLSWMKALQNMAAAAPTRSEEHTSELQSLMRISYAVFCLQQKTNNQHHTYPNNHTHDT